MNPTTLFKSITTGLLAVSISSLFTSPAHAEGATLQELSKKAFSHAPEVTIYTAKKFITMDPNNPEATAVAVVGTKILAVGSLEELKNMSKGQPYKVDDTFKDKIVTAGFISQHLHPFLGALSMESAIISIEDWALPTGYVKSVRDHDGYMARLKEEMAKVEATGDPKKPLFTWGYHPTFHGEVNRKELDTISNTRPIFMWHRSCHAFTLNTPALKLCKIDEAFIKSLSKEAQSMSSLERGDFWEAGVFAILKNISPYVASPEQFKHGLATLRDYLQAQGVTAASEPGGVLSKPMTELINGVLGAEETPLRFYFLPDGKSLSLKYSGDELIKETEKLMTWGKGKCQYQPKQVKLFADGAIFSQMMQLRDGYTDGHKGEWLMTPEHFAETFKTYWDDGYLIVVHITGDKGLDMFLDNLSINMRNNPRYDHRCTVAHFGMAQPDQIKTIKRLGALVSGNPYYVTSLADNYAKKGLTAKQVSRMVPMADIEKEGLHFSYHSDMPMAPAQPLFLIDCAVNRITFNGNISAPEQRVSRMGALKAVTIEAAYSWQMENQIGSIEPGKLANFSILEGNPLTVEALKIKDIKVWGTMLEGKIIPVKQGMKKAEGKSVSSKTTHYYPTQKSLTQHAAKAHSDHSHGESHTGCVCSSNRKFAAILYPAEETK